ncbi:MAG: citrate/2-methylcitrate synthase [Pseudomonadota bacterium]
MSWLDRESALLKLGVKPQTLYAYVSRGLISAQTHPEDPRASLYSEADIDRLVKRRRRGRSRADIAAASIAWGDPVMETSITTVRAGRLIYRSVDAVKFAEHASLEDAAALLWQCEPLSATSEGLTPVRGDTAKGRGFQYLADKASKGLPICSVSVERVAIEGAKLLFGFADAVSGSTGRGLYHQRLARLWRLDPEDADLLRRVLVLVADHELNPSSFAARVAASTGASLAACALSGYATLSGPRHGEASLAALAYLRDLLTPHHVQKTSDNDVPAVGHSLYPKGDPRAKALIRWMQPDDKLKRAVKIAERLGEKPANIDMALAALCLKLRLPDEAPFLIFASGRLVGWIAHAMEQAQSGKLIRPRAKYL